MDVVSTCPLRVASVVWQPRGGGWALTAIVKATYRLEPSRSPLAEVQELPAESDRHWDDDPARSLFAPSDRVPFKQAPEVMLVGHAFAPGGKPARSLMAKLLVGELDKVVEVWCDRAFAQDGQLREGRPFIKMPMRWERAAGGPGTWNPVGMRFDGPADLYGAVAVPNLQPPGHYLAWRTDSFGPAGFGPLAPTWPGRAGRLTPEAAAGWAARWSAQPLPEGLEPGFFNAALPDQQVKELRPDERIVLENLHATYARLVTNLAGVRPRAVAQRAGGARQELRLVADTLWIDTDRGVATLVWRGSIRLEQPQEAGRVVVWMELLSAEAAPEVAGKGAGAGDFDDDDDDVTMNLVEQSKREAAGAAAPQPQEAPRAAPSEASQTIAAPLQAPATDVLPFRPLGTPSAASVAPSSGPAAVPSAPPPAMPAAAPRAAGEPDRALYAILGEPEFAESEAWSGPGTSPGRVADPETLPLDEPAPQATPEPAPVKAAELPAPRKAPELPAMVTVPDLPAPVKAAELPAPPPMIGPLATPEMFERGPARAPEAPAPEPKKTAPEPKKARPKAATKKPAPVEVTLEQCAAVAASIARRREETARILEEQGLTREAWEAAEQRWSAAIRAEIAQGKTALLKRFDRAYVEQIERERGVIQAHEYARLAVAAQRGGPDEVLDALGLPRGALMRIERVWLERMARDALLDEKVRAAMKAAGDE